ncbi:M48 family metallopeptidase [uncultured Chryseobacterium sp.]|jgi:Zn-dependent protease with chaperone function|uniref:M48 family metallopeptidase n=1 Tax=uncultured Chryseobacterium sp. TaxID=259322 RepID=UPI00261EC03E|nr:M48 family metallopeptidase [uncultured Chryseobacterium sp.]
MNHSFPKISQAYRSKLTSAIVSISFFFIIYLALILISLLLIFLLGYGAILLLQLKLGYFTLIGALGLFSIGIFVFYFLIKFIFSKNSFDNSHLVEITRTHQPELFAIIDEIVLEAKVQQPKKVYLSPDVNASVSYNSLFWSMFLPVKKDLTIGMGLINSTTVGELKSVLAHEFGHFSQKSMKIAGYVSQAEKIIFDTVYNNKKYEHFILEGSGYAAFKFFGMISVGFINVFQFILKNVSDFLFKNQASLRREMEYHADAIATYITNPKEQSSSLLRLEISQVAFQASFLFYTNSEQKYLPENLYANHTSLMKIISEKNNHPYENGLPQIDIDDLKRYNKTKIEIEDQWASHPDTAKRIERIWQNATKNSPENNQPATQIIRGFDDVCKALTKKNLIFHGVKNVGKIIDNEEFVTLYLEQYPVQVTSTDFNGYYERHTPVLENIDELITTQYQLPSDDLFHDKNVALIHEKLGLESDLYTLNQLATNPKLVKTFKCNGELYPSKAAKNLIPQFTKDLEVVKNRLNENDQQIFLYFYHQADAHHKTLLADQYKKLAVMDKEYDEFQESLNLFMNHLQFMTVQLPFEQIRRHRALLLNQEKPFKNKLKNFVETSSYTEFLTDENKNTLNRFLDSEYLYFNNDRYLENEVKDVFSLVNEYQIILNKTYADFKENLLKLQSDLGKVS